MACRYSLGIKRRLGLARALPEDPPALILDELFNGLDRKDGETFKGVIAARVGMGETVDRLA